MSSPVRLQRSRKKGSRLESPNGLPVVCVTRPASFGNPFKTAQAFREWLANDPAPDPSGVLTPLEKSRLKILAELPTLRGKNLACWCAITAACHADVLLELANA